jgi:hypothetical protein
MNPEVASADAVLVSLAALRRAASGGRDLGPGHRHARRLCLGTHGGEVLVNEAHRHRPLADR